jgi:hypothetical protein
MTTRRSAMRRYPALGYLAATGALALLLPSGLTLPNSGPPTLAEYAPVPGSGEGRSDTGELALPGSGGIGAGGGGGGTASESPDPGGLVPGDQGSLIRKPGTKRCVGNPPRQTEDPLSPPCIAFFEGDNGGATAKGVTADEVRVVLRAPSVSRDRRAGQVVDCAEPVSDEDTTPDYFCKAYMTYFNARYQTYGRRVHLYSAHDLEVDELDERYRLFGSVAEYPQGSRGKRVGQIAAGYSSETRAGHRKNAPHSWAFRPDIDDMAALAASHICLKLVGGRARFAGDPGYQTQPRTFGYWQSGPELKDFDRFVLAGVKERCGLVIDDARIATTFTDQTNAARLKAAGVTTVILMASDSVATITRQATAAQWFPEWVVPGSENFLAANINLYGRLADPLQWANSFALTVDYRRPAIHEQFWYQAFREGCPTCPEPSLASNNGDAARVGMIYDSLTMLFYGIQAAGPRLTIANVDRGLHAIPPHGSVSPFRPAAYFAPGNYTFIKDATALWWDPTGQPPGASERGCWRLAHDGRRFRVGEWHRGDADLRAPGACQGDLFR